jgi:hypothetical protein
MIAVVSKSASDVTVIDLITIISLVVIINTATQKSLEKRHHTLPFISRQAKIRCKHVGIKMVDKYQHEEYIKCGWCVERLVQLIRFPVDPV